MSEGKKNKILIAEDEDSLRKALSLKLEKEGFDLELVEDGKECIEFIKDNPSSVDLLILDLEMPVMGGVEVLKEIEKEQSINNFPVIVLTNFGNNDNLAETLESGVTEFLIKADHPIENIVNKVKEILN